MLVSQPTSINTIGSMESKKKSERKRLYSWSRPTREMRCRGVQSNLTHSEHSISGAATIAFHPSGDWFRGNIISGTQDAYTVYGRKQTDGGGYENECRLPQLAEEQEEGVVVGSGGCLSSPNPLTTPPSDLSDSPQQSYSRSPGELSGCDSLDSELVRRAMENLDLDIVGEGLFDVVIIDFETGMNHSQKGVNAVLEGQSLCLEGSNIAFSSTSSAKGTMADMVISSSIGPSLLGHNMVVFRGEMKVVYKDEPCYPVSAIEGSQWCL